MRKTNVTRLYVMALALVASGASAGEESKALLGITSQQPAEGRFVKTDQGYMVPYTTTIPGTEVSFEMIPIAGGTFKLGSPKTEDGRGDDEGPQIEVTVEPFWMGKYEVTWAEYKTYMSLHDVFKGFQTHAMRPVADPAGADVVTAPSNLYDPSFTFQSGEDPRQPAVTMTQYSAKQYTKWLSKLTGQFYRLPSEAEWEYACRAGTTTAYYFGDDPKKLDEHAWYYDNSDDRTHKVGLKKPNPWGLYDMHGNAAEWVLDEYTEKGYENFAGKKLKAADAVNWPTKLYPRVVRGGTYEFDAEDCRAAARLGSEDDEWKGEDPNVPLSPFWYTSSPATGVGMRVIRPLASDMEAEKYWKADMKRTMEIVDFRIKEEGRGAYGIANPELPPAIKKLEEVKKASGE